MTESGQYFIALLRAAIRQTPPPEKPAAVQWETIVLLGESAHLCGLLLRALEQSGASLPPALMTRLRRQADYAVYSEAVQHVETQRLCAALPLAGVRYCLLKGAALRALYPSPELREMVDVDVLIPADQREKARGVMLSLGYQPEGEQDVHDGYLLPPVMAVELHHRLLSKKSRYKYAFDDPWAVLLPMKEPLRFQMPKTQEYLYLLLHLEKHLSEAGIGARDVLDIYLYRKHNMDELDRPLLDATLEALGLKSLALNMEALGEMWFGDGERTEDLETIGEYVLESGVHGTIRQSVKQNYFTAGQDTPESAAAARGHYLRSRMFPSADELKTRYPSLGMRHWLRPLYLMCYWADAAIGSAADTWARYRAMRDIDSEELKAHRRVMRLMYERREADTPTRG